MKRRRAFFGAVQFVALSSAMRKLSWWPMFAYMTFWIDMPAVLLMVLLAASRPVLAEPQSCIDWNDPSVRRQAVVETASAY